MEEISALYPNWHLIPVGGLLWDHLAALHPNGLGSASNGVPDTPSHIRKPPSRAHESKANMVKTVMRKGEMVPQGIVLDVAVEAMADVQKGDAGVEGFFLVGYPRDIVQAQSFEEKVTTE